MSATQTDISTTEMGQHPDDNTWQGDNWVQGYAGKE